ncbi:hypothetical protein DF156_27900 [Burkholderia ubonensis]|nr:hypothetical protein DF155_26765 [Burkholderia ubonensis]RQP33643.1 hypothetical protein DF156_27900 [Burkholderia ubonensis]RQP35498.1 hypothetical protein DF154_22490 [Burkholderia ubonensis]RQP48876.1 hypothetical protein DF144_26475 [Burkholderia ubonensis]RQP52799.1 hypothetical protein DF151_27410 [Burkholderia ubonensis]
MSFAASSHSSGLARFLPNRPSPVRPSHAPSSFKRRSQAAPRAPGVHHVVSAPVALLCSAASRIDFARVWRVGGWLP